MENEIGIKFTYDERDFEEIKYKGKVYKLFRIVAKRDINNPHCKIKKGDKGGYIFYGTLSQEGECWVDEGSYVGMDCFVGGNAYVVGSKLVHDVNIGNSAVVSYSYLDPSFKVTVFGAGQIIGSKVKGSAFISGFAKIKDSKIEGMVSMQDDSIMKNCVILHENSSISFVNNNEVDGLLISGKGPFSCGNIIFRPIGFDKTLN